MKCKRWKGRDRKKECEKKVESQELELITIKCIERSPLDLTNELDLIWSWILVNLAPNFIDYH